MRSGTKHLGSSPVSLLMDSRRGVRSQWSSRRGGVGEKKNPVCICFPLYAVETGHVESPCKYQTFFLCLRCLLSPPSPPGPTETLFFPTFHLRTMTPAFKLRERKTHNVCCVVFVLSVLLVSFSTSLSNAAFVQGGIVLFFSGLGQLLT